MAEKTKARSTTGSHPGQPAATQERPTAQQRHQQQQQQQQPVSWPASQARRYYSQSATPNEQDSDSDDFVSETDSLLHTTHPHQDNYSKDSGRRDDEPTWREHLAYTLDSSHLAR
ncbi:hypothetical protein BASA61_001536, partial [Batrachochytrium salamandrivorans]